MITPDAKVAVGVNIKWMLESSSLPSDRVTPNPVVDGDAYCVVKASRPWVVNTRLACI